MAGYGVVSKDVAVGDNDEGIDVVKRKCPRSWEATPGTYIIITVIAITAATVLGAYLTKLAGLRVEQLRLEQQLLAQKS